MDIRDLSFIEYYFLDKETMRSALSDHYMYYILKGSGKAVALYEDNKIISYILLYLEKNKCKIVYICTDTSFRRKGYASKLIKELQQKYPGQICLNLSNQLPYFLALSNCVEKLGFKRSTYSNVFTVNADSNLWEKMDKLKFSQMKDFLLRDSSECVSFCEMSASVREQLMNSTKSEFNNQLDPALFLLNIGNSADEKLSTVMIKNGILCSYVLVSRPTKKTVCFEQISESQKDIGLGTVTAPLCCTLEKIKKDSEIEKLNLCILDNNSSSNNYFLSMFSKDEIKITRNINYNYR